MRKSLIWASLVAALVAGVALAQTALTPPTLKWGGTSASNSYPQPVQNVGYDSSNQQPCIVGSTPTCGLQLSGAITPTVTAKTVTVTVTPTVTAGNAYGTNFVVGGKLVFANAFQAAGSGILQSVKIRFKTVQQGGFTLFLFNADPSATTWTDAALAAINAADITKISGSVPLNCSGQLGGTSTYCYADGIAQAHAPGGTTLWGVLLANNPLTNNFASTSDVQVSLTILDD